jgi:SAM-dependent methyltransferase
MEVWYILLIILLLGILNYLSLTLQRNLIAPYTSETLEGFEEQNDIAGAFPDDKGIIRWLGNDELYDSFYASVYDQLTQGSVRTQAEIGLILHEWTKRGDDLKTFEVLDAGCGTGIATCSLAKIGAKRVVGLDKSQAMIVRAKTKTLQQTTLTPEQKDVIQWRHADLIDPSAAAGGEFTHALLLYFTIYYFADKEALFRNLHFWVKPGGKLVVHVVNKHKFDPMLESAAPWLGFSLQKYSKERITKSEVVFNKFKYAAEFDLQDPAAEFRETFRFEDKVRRQKHAFRMEDMNKIVGYAKVAGWDYAGYTDLTPVGAEYMYHLHFKRA